MPLEEDGLEIEVSELVPPDVEELPDGGALIIEKEVEVESTDFDENLAVRLDSSTCNKIARNLLDLLERDAESRKAHDEIYERGLRLTGMDQDASVGANFEGASHAVHPALAEAAVDFAAHAIKELLPAAGPVRTHVTGEVTEAKLAKAERKRQYLNWQLTQQMPEYRRELEQLLTQNPLAGSQFLKFYRDEQRNRNCVEFVPSDKIRLPFSATSFATARRKAHVLDLPKEEVEARIASGLYCDFTMSSHGMEPEPTLAEQAAQRIEGKESTGYNEDSTRRLYEVYVWYAIADDTYAKGKPSPYIITIDEFSQKVVAIYRNWDPDDILREELPWIVEWPFIPWRGALTVGLVHLIGGLTVAATGALNALLDSAHVNNMPTAVALKGSRLTGQSKQIEPTTIQILEGPAGLDDIRKLAMPLPYNPPSPVLFQLLGWLTEQTKNVVTTASEKIADATNTGPVGTTYAMIEQGAIVFSTIHTRLHNAQKQGLAILCRLNAQHLSDKETVAELGELVVSRADFEGPMDIIPVSDPNIFSEAQRWSQLQAVFQLSQDQRVQYDIRALHARALELLHFPRPEEILPEPAKPQPINPVAENVNATRGMQLMAHPHEDHLAHLRSHLDFVTSPIYQLVSTTAVPMLFPHIQQHLVLLYAQLCQDVSSQFLGQDITAFTVDIKMSRQVDALLADAAPHVRDIFQQAIGPLMPQLMAVVQQMQQMAQQQQQPLDPQSQVAREVGMAEVQRKAQRDQAELQSSQVELQQKAEVAQQTSQIRQAELQLKQQVATMQAEVERLQLEQQRQAELLNARTEIEKNIDDNKTELLIEQFRLALKQELEQLKLGQSLTKERSSDEQEL